MGSFRHRVCKKGFCAIHGISTKRVERLSSHIAVNTATTAPPDMRGKHHNRPNSISPEITQQVHNHIKSFPRCTSHYSRSKNIKKHYLSPELNIKKMYELYLERYEQDVYKYWFTNDKSAHKPKVSYDFYFRYFKSNFNMTFGHPRSDTCQVCDRIENQLKGKDNLSQEEIKALETERNVHQTKAKVFFDDLQEKAKLAKDDPSVETLCFDHEQNAPLPKVPAGDAFYLRQIWMYNFCINSSKHGKAYFYMYDEVTGKKTPNETISFLDHYLENTLDKDVKTLYIFSDNCGAQNKNKSLMQYLYTLVRNDRFEKIVHRFPEPGHSFLPCDRCFGVVEKHVRKIERIFLPSEYIKHYKNSSPKNFIVIPVTQNMIFNFVAALDTFFKKTIYSKEKHKFKISQYKVFEYSAEHKTQIRCSLTGSFLLFYDFVIQKRPNECPVPQKDLLYAQPLALKHLKYENVMLLAEKYVPKADIAYYTSLVSDQTSGGHETDVTDDGEFST